MFKHACLFQSDPARIDMDVNIPRSDRRTRRLGAGREEEQVILEPGSRVELYCPVIGIEDPKVAWFKRGYSGLRLVRPGNDTGHVTVNTTKLGGKITAVLSITSITTDDYGMYVCRTNNMAGEDQARIVLAGELCHLIALLAGYPCQILSLYLCRAW